MALIRDTNHKFSLSKTHGHSCPKILNDLWVFKPDTHPKRCMCSRLKASNTIFVFQEPLLYDNQESRLNNDQEQRLKQQLRAASLQQLRIASLWQLRVTSQLHWSSRLRLISVTTTSMRAACSHMHGVCPIVHWQKQSTTLPV